MTLHKLKAQMARDIAVMRKIDRFSITHSLAILAASLGPASHAVAKLSVSWLHHARAT